MAAIDFPASPTVGQIFAAPNGISYKWTGTIWISVGITGVTPGTPGYAWSLKVTTADFAVVHATATKVPFNSAVFERNGAYFNSSNNRVSPPAGLYYVSALLRYAITGAVSKNAHLWIRKNGINLDPQREWFTFEGEAMNGTTMTHAIVDIAAGDYLELWTQQEASNSGNFNALAATASWDGFRIDGVQGSAGAAGTAAGVAVPAHYQYTTYDTAAGVIPFDNTIPLSTEGKRVFLQNYTASNAAHRIRVRASGGFTFSLADTIICVLYIDGTAVRTRTIHAPSANAHGTMFLEWEGVRTSGAHSYEIRVGGITNSVILNGSTSGAAFAGTMSWVLTIEELNAP